MEIGILRALLDSPAGSAPFEATLERTAARTQRLAANTRAHQLRRWMDLPEPLGAVISEDLTEGRISWVPPVGPQNLIPLVEDLLHMYPIFR